MLVFFFILSVLLEHDKYSNNTKIPKAMFAQIISLAYIIIINIIIAWVSCLG